MGERSVPSHILPIHKKDQSVTARAVFGMRFVTVMDV